MTKVKSIYACTACGAQSPKWVGQCADCGAWNSFSEEVVMKPSSTRHSRFTGYDGASTPSVLTRLVDVQLENEARMTTGLAELDRVLGGGLVTGSVVLMGGDPGIGKSTVLLQTVCHISQQRSALYVTGE